MIPIQVVITKHARERWAERMLGEGTIDDAVTEMGPPTKTERIAVFTSLSNHCHGGEMVGCGAFNARSSR